jgi:hypothetical protein
MLSCEASEVPFFYPTFDRNQYPLHLREEEFEDTIGVIRIRKSKDRQHNGQRKKSKRTNNDLETNIRKTKDRVTQLTNCKLEKTT